MLLQQRTKKVGGAGTAALFALLSVAAAASAAPVVRQRAGAAPAVVKTLRLTRASLANTASFTVTQTIAPRTGSKTSTVMRVEVKGKKARVEFNNPALGAVTYLANEKGFYLYVPANKVAQKQSFQGGVDQALALLFEQVNRSLKTAKKVGTATVSGQATDVFRNDKAGATVYVGRSPGFRLPVKAVVTNEGGTRTTLVTSIKTNVALADARFALPAGVQIIESNGAAAGGASSSGFPGGRL